MKLFASKENTVAVGQIEDLRLTLSRSGIPVDQWGRGSAKTIEHLLNEITNGETVLVKDHEGVVRQVSLVNLRVLYNDGNGRQELAEDRQVFTDGRERRRDLGGSIAEKMEPHEKPQNAAIRALREELGIGGKVKLKTGRTETETKESPSYPGLNTKYVKHYFEAELGRNQYQPEGYLERQTDKTTYFVWKKS